MKPQVYGDPRPAEHFAPFHERVRRAPPGLAYDLIKLVMLSVVRIVYRLRAIDRHKVPRDGPAIVAPNHFSYMDHFFAAVPLPRKVQFMGKSQLFKGPMKWVYSYGGVFPVRRGQADEEAFKTAHAVLARGGVVLMYPEGGRSRSGELRQARPGIGRLALESGAPVTPTAIIGSDRVRDWRRLRFPSVTVRYGDPLAFEPVECPSREESLEAANQIFARIRDLHDAMSGAGDRREPGSAAAPARSQRRG